MTLTEEIEEARMRAQDREDYQHEVGKQLAALAMTADALDRLEGHTLQLTAEDRSCITLHGPECDAVIAALRARVVANLKRITSQEPF